MADLVILGLDLPPYSVRGAVQTLQPIAAASQMARTVNGALVDLSVPEFRRFRSTISCEDQQVPSFVFPGSPVTVDCMAELSYRTDVGAPIRTIVPGSSRLDGAFTFYRPRLSMRVVDYAIERNEYDAIVGWSLVLEEV